MIRFRDQNVGLWVSQVPVASQSWSCGVSGQCEALVALNLLASQSKVSVGVLRSAASKTTRSGAAEP